MKKVLLAACIAASVMFVACNGEKPKGEETNTEAVDSTEMSTEETPMTNDTANMATDSNANTMPADSSATKMEEGAAH